MTEWDPIDPGHVPPATYCPAPSYRPAPTYAAMAPVPWAGQYTVRPARSWRVVTAVIIAIVALLGAGLLVLNASAALDGHGVALADKSRDFTVRNLTGGRVEATYPAGHFRATFPSEPTPDTDAITFAGVTATLHVLVVPEPERVLVAGVDMSRPIPGTARDAMLQSIGRGFANSGRFTVVSQGATTFQGHAAWRATVRDSGGKTIVLLTFVSTEARMHLIIAPEGSSFDTVAASFVALP